MANFTEIIGYLTAAAKGVKSIADVASEAAVQEKTVALNNVIIPLQSAIMEMQAEHQRLIDVKKELEQKLIDNENWNADALNYEFLEVSFGVRVYSEKSQTQRIYDRVWLCPNCFESKQKRVLQLQHRKMPWEYVCNHCKSSFMVRPVDDK